MNKLKAITYLAIDILNIWVLYQLWDLNKFFFSGYLLVYLTICVTVVCEDIRKLAKEDPKIAAQLQETRSLLIDILTTLKDILNLL